MDKVLIKSKNDYIEYCKKNEIVNMARKYSSLWCDIEDGMREDYYFDSGDFISVFPKSYPCIFVWDEHEYSICGYFIYPDDFNN